MRRGWTAEEITRATGGRLIAGAPDTVFEKVGTDSRKVERGALFIPLKGEKFDGHRFIRQAEEGGAGGILKEKGAPEMPAGLCIEVRDTLRALQDLAAFARKNFGGRVIAITGSNGKTTTKEMLASILEQKFRLLKTEGNLNNHIGLPLTILKLTPEHQILQLEMGINHPGELTRLCEIARPELGVITNIGETHLEGLGGLEGVARAKGELLDFLEKGTAVLNRDSPFFGSLAGRQKGRMVSFGFSEKADVRGVGFRVEAGVSAMEIRTGDSRFQVRLSVQGAHNGANALAAAAAALSLGVAPGEVAAGLASFTPVPLRSELRTLPNGLKILVDAYNANPSSMEAALTTLAGMGREEGRETVAVLGAMLELGPDSPALHRKIGKSAAGLKIGTILLYGPEAEEVRRGAMDAGMAGSAARVCGSHREIAGEIRKFPGAATMVLIKGSRGMKMEQVLEYLK